MLGPFGLHPKGTMRARALPAARALAARGHEVSVLMPPWHTPEEAGQAWEEGPGLRIEQVSLRGLGLPGLGHALVAQRMARRARALRPDVIHVFKPKAYGALAADLPAARRSGAALVMDSDDWEGPGGWNEIEPYGPLQRQVFAWQERHGLRSADQVTVASRALQTLCWAMGVPPERVTYLPNGVEGEVEGVVEGEEGGERPPRPSAGGADEARPLRILLYTRFFEFPIARPLDWLQGLRARGFDARLVLAGRGLFGEEVEFLALARERGLDDAVEDEGWLEPARAAAVFSRCDLAIYPFADGLVNRTKSAAKLLALLDAGLPVVAEAVGQNREVIEDGRSGRLVPPGDTEAAVDALAALAADPDARRRMGRAAHARIREAFHWRRLVLDLEDAYERTR